MQECDQPLGYVSIRVVSGSRHVSVITETISFRVSDEPQLATLLQETTKDLLVYTL